MADEQEVEEHIQQARNPFDKTVAGTMAIIAALLAAVSVLGQHFNTEELLMQGKASDQWAFSQAKDIRRYSAHIARDLLAASKAGSGPIQQYADDENKYQKQHDQIQEQAREYERERDKAHNRANRFHLGEIFLEVAIVFSSLSILIKVRALFFAGAVAALIGIGIALTGWTA